MFGLGGLVKHKKVSDKEPSPSPNGHFQALPGNTSVSTSYLLEEDPAQGQKFSYNDSKVPPSDIPAESLCITSAQHSGRFSIDASENLIMKIYFQKKQFIWEFTSSKDGVDRPRKKKFEVKFSDIECVSINARDGAQGRLEISTS